MDDLTFLTATWVNNPLAAVVYIRSISGSGVYAWAQYAAAGAGSAVVSVVGGVKTSATGPPPVSITELAAVWFSDAAVNGGALTPARLQLTSAIAAPGGTGNYRVQIDRLIYDDMDPAGLTRRRQRKNRDTGASQSVSRKSC